MKKKKDRQLTKLVYQTVALIALPTLIISGITIKIIVDISQSQLDYSYVVFTYFLLAFLISIFMFYLTICKNHIFRKFQKITGQSIHQYLNRMK